MKKIKNFEKELNKERVNYYQLDRHFSEKDIRQIVDVLSENGVKFKNFRLSNSLDQPDHFFRLLPSLKDLFSCPIDDKCIDDFGLRGIYSNVEFALTFDFAKDQVITIVKTNAEEKVDLEGLLMLLER